MDKTERTIQLLLAASIALLFPVLVYFAVLTMLPQKQPVYPQYPISPQEPFCSNTREYNSITKSYTYDLSTPECMKQNQEYQQKLSAYNLKYKQYTQAQKQYQANQDKYDKRTKSDRAVVAIFIALVAIAFGYYMRHAKELAGGLVCGAALIIVVGISSITGYMGSTKKDGTAVVAMTISFAVLTALLYLLDRALPNLHPPSKTTGKEVPKVPSAATAAAPEPVVHSPAPPAPADAPPDTHASGSKTTDA